MNENERPAIGSSEAAVLTVVELIARAVQVSEQHLAYWLDLYYQVRSRHEAEKGASVDDVYCLMESISDTLDAIRWPPEPKPAPAKDINEKLAAGVGAAVEGALLEVTADGPTTPEPPAGSKKNRG